MPGCWHTPTVCAAHGRHILRCGPCGCGEALVPARKHDSTVISTKRPTWSFNQHPAVQDVMGGAASTGPLPAAAKYKAGKSRRRNRKGHDRVTAQQCGAAVSGRVRSGCMRLGHRIIKNRKKCWKPHLNSAPTKLTRTRIGGDRTLLHPCLHPTHHCTATHRFTHDKTAR